MNISLNKFTTMAGNGGILKLDSQDPKALISKGTSLGGKIVNWLRATLAPGTVSAENKKVMAAFITAIQESPEYSGEIGQAAAKGLEQAMASGKSLKARMVSDTLKTLAAHKCQINGLNRGMASRFAHDHDDTAGSPHSFGRVFADVLAEKGAGFRMSDTDTGRLEEIIQNSIMSAGNKGQKTVSTLEARSIAEKEIKRFVGNKMDMLARVDARKDIPLNHKPSLKTHVLKTHWTSVSKNTNGAALDTHYALKAVLREMADHGGLPFAWEEVKSDDLALVNKVRIAMLESKTDVLPMDRVKDIVKGRLEERIQAKKKLVDLLDSHGAFSANQREKVTSYILSSKVTETRYLKSILNMAPKAVDLLTGFAQPGLSRLEMIQGLSSFLGQISDEIKELLGPNTLRRENLNDLAVNAINVGLLSASMDTEAVFKGLGSDQAKDLISALDCIAYTDKTASIEVTDPNTGLFMALGAAFDCVGKHLGKSEDELNGLARDRSTFNSVHEIPVQILEDLKAAGIPVPETG